jgi:predicted permease
MTALSVLGSAILPVLSIAVVGYLLSRALSIETDAIATVSIYVLLPALVFDSLATSEIAGGTVAVFLLGTMLFSLAMAVLGEGVGRTVSTDGGAVDATVMTGAFPNVGNYGIPFMAFAFGAVGRSAAVLFVVGQSLVMYTLGVYVASRGAAASARTAVIRILKLPLLYATVAGLVVQAINAVPPTDSTAMETIGLVGDAAIPLMLLLLGMELANMGEVGPLRRVLPGSVLKLFVAPLVAAAIGLALGLSGTIGRVFVLEAAMPTAITPLALSVEFGRGSRGLHATESLASAIRLTTLASVLTLTALLALITSGWSPI